MKFKSWIFLILIISVLAVYGYFKATPGVEDQADNLPEIEIRPTSFDFGKVEYGKVLEYTFKVKNLGEETLEIKRVATSCACTTAKVTKEKISPREEAELLVIFDTGAMSGPMGKGEQERVIYVKSNDPINSQVEVMIYADIR